MMLSTVFFTISFLSKAFSVTRHASGTRIGLMDNVLPVVALVCGVVHPR